MARGLQLEGSYLRLRHINFRSFSLYQTLNTALRSPTPICDYSIRWNTKFILILRHLSKCTSQRTIGTTEPHFVPNIFELVRKTDGVINFRLRPISRKISSRIRTRSMRKSGLLKTIIDCFLTIFRRRNSISSIVSFNYPAYLSTFYWQIRAGICRGALPIADTGFRALKKKKCSAICQLERSRIRIPLYSSKNLFWYVNHIGHIYVRWKSVFHN